MAALQVVDIAVGRLSVNAADTSFEEDSVMTSMDGYTVDEGGEEGNMFDESLADTEEDDDDDYLGLGEYSTDVF